MKRMALIRRCVTIAVGLFLVLGCTTIVEAQKKQLFRGSVIGYDGKPMKKAHVEMWRESWGNRFAGTVNIGVSSKGTFISKLRPGLYTIQFAGVDHEFSERRHLYIDSTMECTVHAQLARSAFIPLEAIDTVLVSYIKPGSFRERIEKPMRDLGDGHFQVQITLPDTKDGLRDYLEIAPSLLYSIVGIVPERWVNGTDQDHYTYDGGGDFFSSKKITDTLITVQFDYNALTAFDQDLSGSEYRFHIDGDPVHHPYAMLARRIDAYRDIGGGCGIPYADSGSAEWDYYIEQGIRPLNLADTVGRFDERRRMRTEQADSASVYLAEIEEAGNAIGQARLESLLLLYLNAVRTYELRVRTNALHESDTEVKQWIQRSMDTIVPSSPVWNEWTDMLKRFHVLSDSAYYDYAERVLRENPSPVARYRVFDQLNSNMRHDTTNHRRLQSLYAKARQLLKGTVAEKQIELLDIDPLEEARKQYIERRKGRYMNVALYKSWDVDSNSVGKTVPPFHFFEHGDSSVTFTNESLAGKPYILCLGYVSDIERIFLEETYARYANKGLQVVLAGAVVHQRMVDDSMRTAIYSKYHPEKDQLPWPIAQAEDEDLKRMRAALKAFSIGHFLVGPDGIIVASGVHMYEQAIELSVEKYFEGKLE